jgi:hypothetical protein
MRLTDGFLSARQVGTPSIMVRTPDPASSIAVVRQTLIKNLSKTEGEKVLDKTPMITWDALHGLRGLNDKGSEVLNGFLKDANVQRDSTTNLPIALMIVEDAGQIDMLLFIHNPHLFWDNDPLVIQATLNLRDKFKANGNMLLLLTSLGTAVPPMLNNDLLVLEDPLPTRGEIKQIIRNVYAYAKGHMPKNVPATVSEEILAQGADALVGIAYFPAEQAAAMSLDMTTGKFNIRAMWDRKKIIIGATPGLSFYEGEETLKDAGGLENIKNYLKRLMKGKRGANILLRLDEIEKMFAGAQTDTSGVKGDLLGNFLSWVEDKHIICMLFLGVPGASKSWVIYCTGGEFGKPVLNFDVSGMQDSLVGNSGKNLRNAEATVEAISDGQIVLMATANSLRGLPAELISRFEKGGIFFFAPPTPEEQKEILDLKIKKYHLTPAQIASVPSMEGWTGREIDSMCDKADMLDLTLVEAGQYVVPLMKSHAKDMEELQQSAHNRFLSASTPGLYQYVAPKVIHKPTVTTGRVMREDTPKG